MVAIMALQIWLHLPKPIVNAYGMFPLHPSDVKPPLPTPTDMDNFAARVEKVIAASTHDMKRTMGERISSLETKLDTHRQ
eukprot:5532034-Amphidinium_carterae.1